MPQPCGDRCVLGRDLMGMDLGDCTPDATVRLVEREALITQLYVE
jgi:hypothetical protein